MLTASPATFPRASVPPSSVEWCVAVLHTQPVFMVLAFVRRPPVKWPRPKSRPKMKRPLDAKSSWLTRLIVMATWSRVCAFVCTTVLEQGDVSVDVRAGLPNIRLINLHHAQMPNSKATDELATWARNLHRKGVVHPFPFQVIKPFCFTVMSLYLMLVSFCRTLQGSYRIGVAILAPPSKKCSRRRAAMRYSTLCIALQVNHCLSCRRLFYSAHAMSVAGTSAADAQKAEKMTLLQWTVAFHRYTIAAACAPVDGAKGHCIWDYESSMAHMDVVLQVLCRFAIAFFLMLSIVSCTDWAWSAESKEAGLAGHHLHQDCPQVLGRAHGRQ